MRLSINTSLQNGKYRIIEMIGQGGFGITYKAETYEVVQRTLGEMRISVPVAIKEFFLKDTCFRNQNTRFVDVYPEKEALFANFKKRLLERESLLVSKLRHPTIVTVLDAFEENNTAYMVMEYIEGIDLNKILEQKKRLPLELSLFYAEQIADALTYAHQNGVIHMDIKPANILILPEDRIKIIDFGIAKHYSIATQESLNKNPTIVGHSPHYAPPEQCVSFSSEIFTPATDVYSFAATLYQCITGNIPFEASARIQEEMPLVHECVPSIPEHIGFAIAKAMTLRRKERFQTVAAFMEACKETAPVTLSTPPLPNDQPSENNQSISTKTFLEPPLGQNEKKERTSRKGNGWIITLSATVVLLISLIMLYLIIKKDLPKEETTPMVSTLPLQQDSIIVPKTELVTTPVVEQNPDPQPKKDQPTQPVRVAETTDKSQNNPQTNAQKDSLDQLKADAEAKQLRLNRYQQYDKNLGSDYMVVQKVADKKWGIIDREGYEHIVFSYKQASSLLRNGCYGLLNEQNEWDVFDSSLVEIASKVSDLSSYR
ncbi:MAG: protein kinase [Prevotellaceae bacterium]|jgi:serine/threonine-protein kinase|nr:protein kinase [Prevotellaceae bacterium]